MKESGNNYFRVTQTVRLFVQLDLVETGLGRLLVFPDFGHDFRSQDLVPVNQRVMYIFLGTYNVIKFRWKDLEYLFIFMLFLLYQKYLSLSKLQIAWTMHQKPSSLRQRSSWCLVPLMITNIITKGNYIITGFVPLYTVRFESYNTESTRPFSLYEIPNFSKRLELFYLPMLEIRIDHPVWEALATNTDTFKHTVTSQLMHDEGRVSYTCEASKT